MHAGTARARPRARRRRNAARTQGGARPGSGHFFAKNRSNAAIARPSFEFELGRPREARPPAAGSGRRADLPYAARHDGSLDAKRGHRCAPTRCWAAARRARARLVTCGMWFEELAAPRRRGVQARRRATPLRECVRRWCSSVRERRLAGVRGSRCDARVRGCLWRRFADVPKGCLGCVRSAERRAALSKRLR